MKRVLTRYIETHPDASWEEVVTQATSVINNRVNRSIGMSPNNVINHWQELSKENRHLSHRLPFLDQLREEERIEKGGAVQDHGHKYKLGDTVIIPFPSTLVDKESDRAFRYHIYTIKNIQVEEKPFLYQVADGLGNVARRWLYAAEMRPVEEPDVFPVSAVREKKMVRGKPFVLVSWTDYDRSFDSWIPKKDLHLHS